ncbi:MAG: hypothetical protein JJW00_08315 [Sulfurimonas sp.]|nr:hypothetical protein [Sulfurimonas sp.]
MDDELKLNIITIIKKEQLNVVEILGDSYTARSRYLDYESELSQADKDTKIVIRKIEKMSHHFSKTVDTKEEMLKLFTDFFQEINPHMEKIKQKYRDFKRDKPTQNSLFPNHISILIIQKILQDYISFLIKLEGGVLGIYDKEVIYMVDVEEQIEIIDFVQNNTNQSIFMPLLLSFGIGYLVGS